MAIAQIIATRFVTALPDGSVRYFYDSLWFDFWIKYNK